MKKVLFRTMMVAVCTMMMASVMTSCEGKNDPQKPEGEDTTKVDPPVQVDTISVAALMNIEFQASDKMLEVFDITLQYYDANSELQTVAYKGGDASQKIITKSLPAKTGVRFSLAKRADLDTTVVKEFEGKFIFGFETYAVNKEGTRSGALIERGGSNGDITHPISKLDKYLEAFAKDKYYVFEFDANGNLTRKDWE